MSVSAPELVGVSLPGFVAKQERGILREPAEPGDG